MKYFFIIAGFILVLFAIAFTSMALRQPGRPNMTLTFVGFTNDVAGNRLADFKLLNASPETVERFAVYRVQSGNEYQWTNYHEGWFTNKGNILMPGTAEVITIPAATNQTRWRVAFNVKNKPGTLFSKASKLVRQAQSLGFPTKHQVYSYAVWSNPVEE